MTYRPRNPNPNTVRRQVDALAALYRNRPNLDVEVQAELDDEWRRNNPDQAAALDREKQRQLAILRSRNP